MNVDAIKEAADAREWEELNKEDPRAQKAADLLTKAYKTLEQAQWYLKDAVSVLEYTPETFRVDSLADDAENLAFAVWQQIERMK